MTHKILVKLVFKDFAHIHVDDGQNLFFQKIPRQELYAMNPALKQGDSGTAYIHNGKTKIKIDAEDIDYIFHPIHTSDIMYPIVKYGHFDVY